MHAIDAQKKMINLMIDIDETEPLPGKEGRMLVAINVLAHEITSPENPAPGDDRPRIVARRDEIGDSYVSPEEAKKWIAHAIEKLPLAVALIGNFGSPDRLK